MMKRHECLICGGLDLVDVAGRHFRGVTSDCKPCERVGRLAICRSCTHVQKLPTDEWQSDVSRIYAEYAMYPLSGGVEQGVFNGSDRVARSTVLVRNLTDTIVIHPRGRLLDVGCGNGAFLRAFGDLHPDWDLFGFEQSEFSKEDVLRLRGVKGFYSGSLDQVDAQFDVISMIHVAEHLLDPVGVATRLISLLAPGGALVVHTPHFLDNPFDLMVADHCSHFRLETLRCLLERAGLTVVATEKWIPKEIGVVARVGGEVAQVASSDFAEINRMTTSCIEWLEHLSVHAAAAAARCKLGIFGTSIAGIWLANALGDSVQFFVDEDTLRQGKTYLGRPIIAPGEVATGAGVYLAFPSLVAAGIYERLARSFPSTFFIVPPTSRQPRRVFDEPTGPHVR